MKTRPGAQRLKPRDFIGLSARLKSCPDVFLFSPPCKSARANVKDAGRRPAVPKTRSCVALGQGLRSVMAGHENRRTQSRRSQAWRFSVWLRGRRLKPTLLGGGDAAWGRWI